jgi:predicted nucleotidyltransferase
MTEFGLSDHERALLNGVFAAHPRVSEVRVFGSRARGTARRESDVDLALFGDLDERESAIIADALDELPLPYRFDVKAYDSIRYPPLREHIDRIGRAIYVREPNR